jgi:ABC-type transport system involved in Fe-S cluster assembly fused permease/ATPase subunit
MKGLEGKKSTVRRAQAIARKSRFLSMKHRLKTFFLIQLIYLFEDDAIAHLKTKMPMGHRNVLQNQLVIAIVLTAAFPTPFIIAGILFWLTMSVQFFLIYVLCVWSYFTLLGVAWLKLTGWRPGGSRDLRMIEFD